MSEGRAMVRPKGDQPSPLHPPESATAFRWLPPLPLAPVATALPSPRPSWVASKVPASVCPTPARWAAYSGTIDLNGGWSSIRSEADLTTVQNYPSLCCACAGQIQPALALPLRSEITTMTCRIFFFQFWRKKYLTAWYISMSKFADARTPQSARDCIGCPGCR